MVIIFLMVYGLMMIVRWSGRDIADRRIAHEQQLRTGITQSYVDMEDGPLRQIDPYFYTSTRMNTVWDGN